MTNYQKLNFYNPTVGNLSFDGVIKEIFSYMQKAPGKFYDIVVGCDSSSEEMPAFPVALVVWKVGQGGRFFLTKIRYKGSEKKFYNFHQRILEEVFLSCELALSFREVIGEKIKNSEVPLNYRFQYIHADIGEQGPTKDMIREVIGLIKSNGFEPKIKPESFAASVVADRFS